MKEWVFHPLAEEELATAVVEYGGRRTGLGGAFRREVQRVLDRISANPFVFADEDGDGVRVGLLKRFSYSLVYLDLTDNLWLVAVPHHRRRPGYWRDRLI